MTRIRSFHRCLNQWAFGTAIAALLGISLYAGGTTGCVPTEGTLLNPSTEEDSAGSGDSGDFNGSEDDFEESTEELIDKETALEVAIENGLVVDNMIFADMLPYVVSESEAIMTWGFIEKNQDGVRITFVNSTTSELIAVHNEVPENLQEFVDEFVNTDGERTPPQNQYLSYPWGWRLVFDSTNSAYLTCGYGCGYHTGIDYYATDWDPGNIGHLLESPANCWVTYAGWSNGYGNNVVAECGPANGSGSLRYIFRAAHMKTGSLLVSPGQWIGKGRNLGQMGNTGISSGNTGGHVHYVVYSGTVSGASVSGGSVPINNWPSTSDSLCNGALSGWNMWGLSWTRNFGRILTNGCP